jgi:spermidine/putrescine transport system substrate-binding protein
MQYFDTDANKSINQMWINVRCFNIAEVPVIIWCIVLVAILVLLYLNLKRLNFKDNFRRGNKTGGNK